MAKISGRERGRPLPIGVSVLDAISAIREKHRRGAGRSAKTTESYSQSILGAKEMLFLGRIVNCWRDIVGPDVAKHTLPVRLIRGNFQIVCSDSQWMQTFHFVKESVKEKMGRMFPEAQIKNIYSRVGVIPEGVLPAEVIAWPDWEKEPVPGVSGNETSDELAEIITRCRRKMAARKKGILSEGRFLCPQCQANITFRSGEICSVCVFHAREQELIKARTLLSDTPWLTYGELRELIETISEEEYHLLIEELMWESKQRVDFLLAEFVSAPDKKSWAELRREMIRYIVLQTGWMPFGVNLDDPAFQKVLEPRWLEVLKKPDEEQAC